MQRVSCIQAHLAGCRVTEEIFGIEIEEKADTQLYQAIKALDNATYAVRKGGVIILVSECSEGIGSQPFQEYFQLENLLF